MRPSFPILLLTFALPGAALAQQSGAAGADPNLDSAGQFRNITSTGVTKPPGRSEGASDIRNPDATGKQKAIDRKIETGICIGCN